MWPELRVGPPARPPTPTPSTFSQGSEASATAGAPVKNMARAMARSVMRYGVEAVHMAADRWQAPYQCVSATMLCAAPRVALSQLPLVRALGGGGPRRYGVFARGERHQEP